MSERDAGHLPVEHPVHVPASIVQRVAGALVDGLLTSMVVVVPMLVGLIDVEDLEGPLPPVFVPALILFGAVYTIVPTALWGQTLGKIAVGSRVVVESDGSLPGWRRSFLRWALPGLLARLSYVGLVLTLAIIVSIVIDPLRRGLHDRVAGTIVVRVPRPSDPETR